MINAKSVSRSSCTSTHPFQILDMTLSNSWIEGVIPSLGHSRSINAVIVFKSLYPNSFQYTVVVALVSGITLAYMSNRPVVPSLRWGNARYGQLKKWYAPY